MFARQAQWCEKIICFFFISSSVKTASYYVLHIPSVFTCLLFLVSCKLVCIFLWLDTIKLMGFWDQVKELRKQVYALWGLLLRYFKAVCTLIPTFYPKLFSSKLQIFLNHLVRADGISLCTMDIGSSSTFKQCFLLLKIIFSQHSWMDNLELFQVSGLVSKKITTTLFSGTLFSQDLQTSATCSVLFPWDTCLYSPGVFFMSYGLEILSRSSFKTFIKFILLAS